MQETWVQSLVWVDPLEREWLPTPVELPGEFMDRGAWQATYHGVTKSRTQLNDFTFTFNHEMGFPGGSDGKESACNVGDVSLNPWFRKIPWRTEWLPTQV